MRLQAAVQGDLAEFMEAEAKAAETAVTRGVRTAEAGLKAELRAQVTSADLGPRLARTWRGRIFPSAGESAEAAALVWTRAPTLIDAFDRGVTIRSKAGFFLAIPTEAAGARRGGPGRERLTPGAWERRTGMRLRFVYRRGAPSLLVADNVRVDRRRVARANVTRRRDGSVTTRLKGRATAVIFILLPQVTLRKRLDVMPAAERWQERLPRLVLESWPDLKPGSRR